MTRATWVRGLAVGAGCASLLLLAACAGTVPVAKAPPAPGPAGEVVAGGVAPAPAPGAADSIPATTPATTEPLPVPVIDPASAVAATPEDAPAAPASVVDTATGADVFAALRSRFRQPVCTEHPRVREWQKRYAGHPTVFARRMGEILPLLDFVATETEASGLPAEFAFIPLVESWYEPGAIGRGGPVGMWQMIGSTARNHGIRIGKGYDGRLSPVESTRAALSYLRTLGGLFDSDWQAMVMAYNAGEGRLQGALRRSGNRRVSGQDGVPAGLSHITYAYVAKLQALSCLVAEPARHGLKLPEDVRFDRLGAVLVDQRAVSLDQVARRGGLSAERLRALNPAYRAGRIGGDAPRLVLMPRSAGATLAAAAEAPYEPHPGSPANDDATIADATAATMDDAGKASTHRVRSGDTLSQIARRYGLTLKSLLQLNRLGTTSRIHPGQVLRLVP